jgi:hypothetical protein
MLWRGPQGREHILRDSISNGQEAEDAAAIVIDQHHSERRPHLACKGGDMKMLAPRFKAWLAQAWVCMRLLGPSVPVTRSSRQCCSFCPLHRLQQCLQSTQPAHTNTVAAASPLRSRLRPLMSWRNDRSPTTSVVPRPSPSAKPAAVDSTPSMPLAPRLAATGAPTPAGRGTEIPAGWALSACLILEGRTHSSLFLPA